MTRPTLVLACAGVIVLCASCKEAAPPPQAPPTVLVAHPLQQRVTDWDD